MRRRRRICFGRMWKRFGRTRTLSCQPRRIVRICGPRYRRCNCGHVCLHLGQLALPSDHTPESHTFWGCLLCKSYIRQHWCSLLVSSRDFRSSPILVAFLMLMARSVSVLAFRSASRSSFWEIRLDLDISMFLVPPPPLPAPKPGYDMLPARPRDALPAVATDDRLRP